MSKVEMLIFFDESGKKEDYPILMGGIAIPKNIYCRNEFQEMMGKQVHWVNFIQKQLMEQLVEIASNFEDVIKINIINYDYTAVEESVNACFSREQSKEFIARTLYAKFPERIFYGLLRRGVKHIDVEADVVIEKATEYRGYVEELVEKHLNVQALYRGENFKINTCTQKPKGEDIGLEITDLILGIVRFIIKNEPRSKSTRMDKKAKFVIKMLKKPTIYKLFSKRIMFFEWNKNELKEVDFNKYIQAFIVSNHDIWY